MVRSSGLRPGDATRDDRRYHSLLAVMDLVALHPRLDEFLPELALCLRDVVPCDEIGVARARGLGQSTIVHRMLTGAANGTPSSVRVDMLTLPPIEDTRLAGILTAESPLVIRDLAAEPGFEELRALHATGHRSLCLLPLVTSLRRIGIIGFASRRVGAYDEADRVFLQRVASQVAIAIDNVLHYQEALSYQRQLETDRDHWRALLEINNALVSQLDLASLLSAITPNLRRMVPHDFTSVALLQDDGKRVGLHAAVPKLPREIDQTLDSISPGDTPFAASLATGRPMEAAVAEMAAIPESMRRHAEAANVKRFCFIPLVTPRATLGGLSLARSNPEPFSEQEVERATQAAGQIAIAIENALAFHEIAALKDRLALENLYLEDEIRGEQHFEEIIGESRALHRVLAQARSVAPTDTAVLLLGETGTGKELVARAIHSMSARRTRALVTVNCATSPAGLLESEWFGHEKGAFTGALTQKVGRFELAHQGTLFLDEIGDVPLDLQAKLLRTLQEHEIERLGSTRPIRVDFRLIAATNRNLEEMVSGREYRADLYYRLNVFPIRVPPLRERREDIPPLVRYFVQRYARRLRRRVDSVSRESMDALCRWHWPGNVRELQNVIERAVILSQGPTLRVPLSEFESPAPAPADVSTLEAAEREHILKALDATGWVVGGAGGAAERLGLKRTTLVSTMRRLGIVRPKPATGHRHPDG
jgi:formate hydrogenlyase transcriptional activator